jgi:hypothetical protein
MCTEDSCYAEVGFNTITYYVQFGEPSEKTNALSLRDRQEPASTTHTGQYRDMEGSTAPM